MYSLSISFHVFYRQIPVFIFLSFCSTSVYAQNGIWTWMSGSSTVSPTANYGIQGVPAATNNPPGLYEAAEWTDLNGNFWIFGGANFISVSPYVNLSSDLWKYEPSTGLWTWMKGPPGFNSSGVYGTQGIPSPANSPGARGYGSVSWRDANDDLWLFGGNGVDANGVQGFLNDLWKYNIATNEWTWMSGSNIANDIGNFGVLQTPSSSNRPPARCETAAGWIDNASNLWLYGGEAVSSPIADDMWMYNTSTNQWAWMSGQQTGIVTPNYGSLQVPAPTNTPGSRYVYSRWKDTQDNFWLFGGYHTALSSPTPTSVSDMWRYNPITNIWTWMAGSSAFYDSTTFTSQCIPDNGTPSATYENRACWVDDCGRFWHFGGDNGNSGIDKLNTMWLFDPSTLEFTWVTGSNSSNQPGNFGTIGVASTSNSPPSLMGCNGFYTSTGELWIFGGLSNSGQQYNTLWRYQPDPNCPASGATASFTTLPSSGCSPVITNFLPIDTSATSYHWDFGIPNIAGDTSNLANPSWSYPQPGTYTVTLIVTGTASGCRTGTDTSTTTITVFTSPNLGADALLCDGQSITLDAGATGTYLWNTGATTATIITNQAGVYTVELNGFCSDTIVLTAANTEAFVPINVFSPNGDGINDVFSLGDLPENNFVLEIFNRWGQSVFKTTDPSVFWDGSINRQKATEGIYYWIIRFENCKGGINTQTGFVHLLRE